VWPQELGVNDPQQAWPAPIPTSSIVVPLGKYHRCAKTGRSKMFESRRTHGALMTAIETPSSLLEARF
jgi:hypothetical protein